MTYSASGSISVTASDLTEEEVVSTIEAALIDEFEVHPSDVEVSYDSDTGVVTYTINSDDAESLLVSCECERFLESCLER